MTTESLIKTILEHGDYICKQINCTDISLVELNDCNEKDIHEIEIDGYNFKMVIKEIK